MGIHPDPSPAFFPLLTGKLSPNDLAQLKGRFARPGFLDQVAALEADTKALATQFSAKGAAAPSDAWRMLFASAPEPVLWLAYTTKSAPLKAKFDAFFNVWSQARSKIPYQLMQEMRITPDIAGYEQLLDQLFFAIMDEKMETTEAAKAFLEPFSPPAPPPPVNLRRRPVKRESKAAKPRSKKSAAVVAPENTAGDEHSEPLVSAEAPPAPPVSGKTPSARTAEKADPGAATPAPASPAKAATKAAPAPRRFRQNSAKGCGEAGRPGSNRSTRSQRGKGSRLRNPQFGARAHPSRRQVCGGQQPNELQELDHRRQKCRPTMQEALPKRQRLRRPKSRLRRLLKGRRLQRRKPRRLRRVQNPCPRSPQPRPPPSHRQPGRRVSKRRRPELPEPSQRAPKLRAASLRPRSLWLRSLWEPRQQPINQAGRLRRRQNQGRNPATSGELRPQTHLRFEPGRPALAAKCLPLR